VCLDHVRGIDIVRDCDRSRCGVERDDQGRHLDVMDDAGVWLPNSARKGRVRRCEPTTSNAAVRSTSLTRPSRTLMGS
jgi:hypothetical protein